MNVPSNVKISVFKKTRSVLFCVQLDVGVHGAAGFESVLGSCFRWKICLKFYEVSKTSIGTNLIQRKQKQIKTKLTNTVGILVLDT